MKSAAEYKMAFIIGSSRSGTTMVSDLLNAHEEVHALPEIGFMSFFLYQFGRRKSFTRDDIDTIFRHIDIFKLSHPWIGWEFNAESVKKELLAIISSTQQVEYTEICRKIYSGFVKGTRKGNGTLFLDKNPFHTLFADELNLAFPDAKFILMVRDYRAFALSRKQHPDLNPSDIVSSAQRWKMYNDKALGFYNKHPGKVLLVKYEDMVASPHEKMAQIAEFLDIKAETDFEQKKQKYSVNDDLKNIREEDRERFMKKYTDLNRPLNTERSEAWKKQLSQNEIMLCDVICGSTGSVYGYQAQRVPGILGRSIIKLMHIRRIAKTWIDVKKIRWAFYAPLGLKMKMLKRRYKKEGFPVKKD